MKRSAVVAGVLALFVVSLALASMAEARAGGGSSSGSRGSRSFSAPRSPSVPSTPASPSSPQGSLSSPSSPQRPGFGWGGMLGGFLMGGLLGGLLFGGLGHGFGGIGMMDILLIGGLAALAFAFLRRRQQPAPAYAGAPGRVDWTPAETSAVEPMAAGATALDRDLQDLERGFAAIRMMDSGFTPVRFAAHARDLFVRLQSAWSARDLAPIRAELADELAASLEGDLGRLKA